MAGDRITWIDPGGVETILSDHPNVMVLLDKEGFDMPPFSFEEEEIPFEAGSFLSKVNTDPREVDMLVAFRAASAAELRSVRRSFLSLFNPLRGDGRLRVRAPDGSERELICRYKSGLEGTEKRGQTGRWYKIQTLTFRAFDPYWYDVQPSTFSFQLDQNPPKWFPLFPLRLGGEAISSEIQVDNMGDVVAFPNWTIRGPGANPKLTNLTTGESIHLNNIKLDESQYITIDIKPRESQIKLNDDSDLFTNLAFGSTLWRIQPGRNIIRIELPGSKIQSRIDLSFRPRYLGV
jgi:hypothetical protein